ncbi:MAG: hypothetical protein HC910_21150 [Spirulinaceae cyanobacterium SM2_1_0]|nr:hypothetical protein [Spirulinaceae cyanobacterium SM2_1_0]
MVIASRLARIGDWNPQLERELRSRLTRTHLLVTAVLSLLLQAGWLGLQRLGLTIGEHKGSRFANHVEHRYICASSHPAAAIAPWRFSGEASVAICPDSDFMNATIPALNWPLWWLDVLVWLSSLGAALLILGSAVLLFRNLWRESRAGTLHLVRLSPQAAASVLGGKLGGVASLLYWGLLLALPLQLWAAAQAWVGWGRVLMFDGLAIAAAVGVQTVIMAIALSTVAPRSPATTHSPLAELLWFGLPLLALPLTLALVWGSGGFSGNGSVAFGPEDALKVLNPFFFLPYVIAQAPHSLATIGYLNVKDWQQLTWFGWPLWNSVILAWAIPLVAWGVIAATFWQSSSRRYQQPTAPLLSKVQSYWLSAGIGIVLLGFATQLSVWSDASNNLARTFYPLLSGLLFWLLGLGVLLRPSRQAVSEWSRYRHQQRRSLFRELLTEERAPTGLAIALNAAIISTILLFGVLLTPIPSARWHFAVAAIAGTSFTLLWASLWQWWSLATQAGWSRFTALLAAPVALLAAVGITMTGSVFFLSEPLLTAALLWLILGEWLAIALCNWQLTRTVRRLGTSKSFDSLRPSPNVTAVDQSWREQPTRLGGVSAD